MKVRRMRVLKRKAPRPSPHLGLVWICVLVMVVGAVGCIAPALADITKTDVYVSSTSDKVWAGGTSADVSLDGYIVPPSDQTAWQDAVACWEHPNWRSNIDNDANGQALLNSAPGADFVWKSEYVTAAEARSGDIVFLERMISIPAESNSVQVDLYIMTADNAYYFYVNGDWTGTPAGAAGFVGGYTPSTFHAPDAGGKLFPRAGAIDIGSGWTTAEKWTITSLLQPGENWLQIVGVNAPYNTDSPTVNPGCIVYKLVVTYEDPLVAGVDVKPGSDPNSICLNDQGLLPVAILGSEDLDAAAIDPATVNVGGIFLAERGSKKMPKLAYSLEDVNGDGMMDMMVFFDVQQLVAAGALALDTVELEFDAYFSDGGIAGQRITGSDDVRIVPPA